MRKSLNDIITWRNINVIITSLCIFIVCAETEREARKLALCRDLTLLLREKGQFSRFPSIEEAENYDYSDADKLSIKGNRPRSLYGNPIQCHKIIEEMAKIYCVNEVVILSICHDPSARQLSYELIAETFN